MQALDYIAQTVHSVGAAVKEYDGVADFNQLVEVDGDQILLDNSFYVMYQYPNSAVPDRREEELIYLEPAAESMVRSIREVARCRVVSSLIPWNEFPIVSDGTIRAAQDYPLGHFKDILLDTDKEIPEGSFIRIGAAVHGVIYSVGNRFGQQQVILDRALGCGMLAGDLVHGPALHTAGYEVSQGGLVAVAPKTPPLAAGHPENYSHAGVNMCLNRTNTDNGIRTTLTLLLGFHVDPSKCRLNTNGWCPKCSILGGEFKCNDCMAKA